MSKRILLTCGDPNGIGPEIILNIFSNNNFVRKYNLSVIAPKKVLDFYSELLRIENIPAERLIDLTSYNMFSVNPGTIDKTAGKISGDAIKTATELCSQKFFDAMVTLPINKESLNSGGYKFSGHTEMITKLTNSKNVFMMMFSKYLKIVPLTIHIPLNKVSSLLTRKLIFGKIIAVNNTLIKYFNIKKPSIALLSLNPHCSDGGLIGSEEHKTIFPAVSGLKASGFNIAGLFSADGFFGTNKYRQYDAVIAMYHDQAMIPFKIISGDKGVNYTGGLSIIRTSPAHGTAFDIAGKGKSNTHSMIEAIKLAKKLVDNKIKIKFENDYD